MSISAGRFRSSIARWTILGLFVNDTVEIYDRIREMLRRYKKIDAGTGQTNHQLELSRSIHHPLP